MEISLDHKYLTDPEAVLRAQLIVSNLTAHPLFQTIAWPPQVPSLTQLAEAADGLSDAYNAALTRDVVKIGVRKTSREDLNKKITNIGQFVVVVVGDNPDALSGTGFEARRQRSARSHAALQAPPNFTVTNGNIKGTMIAKAGRLDGAGSYEMHVSEQADPSVEEGYFFNASFLHATHMETKGHQPGKNYHFRLRGVSTDGPGPWSAVVSLISL